MKTIRALKSIWIDTSAFRQFVIDRGWSRVFSHERKGCNQFVNRACGQRLGQVQICISHLCEISSAEEQDSYTVKVSGSNPLSRTRFMKKCYKCGQTATLNYRDECAECERNRRRNEDEEDDRRRRENDDMIAALICCIS